MKEKLELKIKELLKDLYGIDKEISLTIPPNKALGDFSTNIAMQIAKPLNKSPKEVAEEIVTKINDDQLISKLEVAGPGFINIFIDQKRFIESTITEILSGNKYVQVNIGKDKSLSIEHTAANPNKHLHIGHLRNFSIADTLVRVMKNANYNVTVQWFNDDQGLQVGKVLWGIKNIELVDLNSETSGIVNDIFVSRIETNKKADTFAAALYVATEKYLSQHAEKNDEIAQIIKDMEKGNNETSEFAEYVTRKIIEGQIQTISEFGVYYDLMISESTMTQSGEVERIIAELFKTGKVLKEEDGKNAGSIVIKGITDSSGKELDDKVLVRSNGTAVYTGKDIVLHLWKYGLLDVNFQFEEFISNKSNWNNNNKLYISIPHQKGNSLTMQQHADLHINVVDQRQSYPLEVVKQSLKILGYEKESDNFHHLAYETVSLSSETAKTLGVEIDSELKSVAMSGRKGIEVNIDSILETMTSKIIEKNENKSEKILPEIAKRIAASALRYYMIKYSYNTIIVFDMDDALRSDGDSGIYLMYAYVRANGILEKNNEYINNSFDLTSIDNFDESVIDLITYISLSKDILQNTIDSLEVNKIANYTFELAKKFSDFYQNINVSNEQDLQKKNFYIAIVKSFKQVYGELLDTLGMEKPEKM